MITLEQYILNKQIDQILEDINNESINEGKVTKAIKRFWKWLFGGGDDSSKKSKDNKTILNNSHFEEFPTNLTNDEIKSKLSEQRVDYIDFKKIPDKKKNITSIQFIVELTQKYPGQFAYIETLLNDNNSILKIIEHNDSIELGVLKCENPFSTDEKNKKVLFTGLCLYIPNLDLINKKVLDKIHKYAGTDKYDKYGFIICLDIMKNCKVNFDDVHLENQLYKQIIKQITTKTITSTGYTGMTTIINTSTDVGKLELKLYKDNFSFSEELNNENSQYTDIKFLYNSKI